MDRVRKKQIFFVCMAIINHELVHDVVSAETSDEAASIFESKFLAKPKNVLGPFLKKKAKPIQNNTPLKFSGKPRQGIYNDWLVNCFILQEPADCCFLIFIKHTEDYSKLLPKGTVIVPISEIRFI